MYSGDHVHECEWYRHTATVLYHMLSSHLAYVNCAHSMQGRLDQVLSTEICMKVYECVQIVFKMYVSILHPTFDTLCCLLLHRVGVLENVVAHLTCAEESAALRCLAVHIAIEGMIEGVLTEIIVSRSIPRHISIDIFCLDSIGQTIRICEQQSQLV